MPSENKAIKDKKARRAAFGEFSLNFHTHELSRNGERIALPQQAARILELLVARHGELVTRDEIRNAIWKDRYVDFEAGLNTAIRKIRRSLGDEAAQPALIETVPKAGYRFLTTPVFGEPGSDASAAASEAPPLALTASRMTIAAAGFFLIAIIVAVVMFNRSAKEDASSIDALAKIDSPGYESFLFGSHAMGQGAYDEAEQHFETAITRDPEYAAAYVGLAHAKVLNRRRQFSNVVEGQALLDHALSIEPDNAVAQHLNARIALYYWRDVDKARTALMRALALSPNDPDLLTTLAYLRTIEGDANAALDAIAAAHEASPLSPELNADYGWVHYKARNWDDAERLCKTSVRLDPDSSFALDCVVHVNHSQGDSAEAAEYGLKQMARRGASQEAIENVRRIPDAEMREAAYWEWTLNWLGQSTRNDRLSQQGIALTMLNRLGAAVDVFDAAFANNHGEPFLSFLAVDPRVDALRRHPEYNRLAELSRTPVAREKQ